MTQKKIDTRYKVNKTFEYNKENGPFENVSDQNKAIVKELKTYGIQTDFFGYKTALPFGVAAGPLYNKDYMKSAAKDGFTVITWKTFRSVNRLAHRKDKNSIGHNIVFVSPDQLLKANFGGKIVGKSSYRGEPNDVSITNSSRMPSSA